MKSMRRKDKILPPVRLRKRPPAGKKTVLILGCGLLQRPAIETAAALKALGVKYARTTVSTHSFALPTDWLHLNPTVHHTEPCLKELTDKFLAGKPSDEFKHREPWLYYVWGHAYEFDDNDNWDVIEDLCRRVSADKNVWAATNGDIYDYVKCYESLVYSLDGERVYNPSHRPVWVEIRAKTYRIGSGETVLFDKD